MTNELTTLTANNVQGENDFLDIVPVDNAKSPATLFSEQDTSMFYSSIQNDGSRESQIKLFSAINDSENALADHLGKQIQITDMVAHSIELEDEITKQTIKAIRVVVIDVEGNGYHAISEGVVSSLQKAIRVFGQAPWNPALTIVPVEVKTRKGFKTLTIKIVG